MWDFAREADAELATLIGTARSTPLPRSVNVVATRTLAFRFFGHRSLDRPSLAQGDFGTDLRDVVDDMTFRRRRLRYSSSSHQSEKDGPVWAPTGSAIRIVAATIRNIGMVSPMLHCHAQPIVRGRCTAQRQRESHLLAVGIGEPPLPGSTAYSAGGPACRVRLRTLRGHRCILGPITR